MFKRWIAFVLLIAIGLTLWGWLGRKIAPAPPPMDGAVVGEEETGPPFFEDVTIPSGVQFTYQNGEEMNLLTMLEFVGGGVGVLDYDGDGLMDLFFTGGGTFTGVDKKVIVGKPCKLYRNLGNGQFKDVTAEVGLDKLVGGQPWFYTHGVAVADFDRDGRPDLLVTGWGRVALLRNIDGRRFEDVTAKAGLDKGITWGISAAWADLDGDGYPDLYITQYVDWSWSNHPVCSYNLKQRDLCTPLSFSGVTHKVYRNTGHGTFSDESARCGLIQGCRQASKGLGVLAIDVDDDGKPDLYVCNDTTDSFLYVNRSTTGQIRFKEMGLLCGVARDEQGISNGSMGVDAGDYDGSGKPSLWITNFEGETHGLYRNVSQFTDLSFRSQTNASGIGVLGKKNVGWGTAFIDFTLDGWEDIFISHGHTMRFVTAKGTTRPQKAVLLRNQGNGRFLPASSRLGSYGESKHMGRGVAFVDLENDGRVDVVISHLNEPVTILRNIASGEHHWLGVQLEGVAHADVVGAKVVLEAGGRKQTRFAKGGGSYASSSDRRLVFGLARTERIDKLTVIWPDRSQQEWTGLAIDRYHTLRQRHN
jgi:hypothetical protein